MDEYLATMKRYSDRLLVFAGSPVLVSDLVSQVLFRLNEEYNLVVISLQGKYGVSWIEMQPDLFSYECRLEYQLTMKTGLTNLNILLLHCLLILYKNLLRIPQHNL